VLNLKKILFTNTNCSWNKGSAAQVISTANIIRKLQPDIEITLISHFPERDSKFCESHKIRVLGSKILNNTVRKILFYLTSVLIMKIGLKSLILKNSIVKEYNNCDMIVDLSGDTLSDRGAFSFDVISSLIFAFTFKKPVILYSQSIGPFKTYSIPFSRYVIEKADRVVVREKITKEYLEDIGVKSHVDLVPDCAFALEPSKKERINEILFKEGITFQKPLVGLSVNGMVGDENYVATIVKVVEHITEDLKANVIFVPHVVARAKGYEDDDRIIGEKIYDLVVNKEKINLIKGDYSPNDLKGIIKMCDMFIGGRMHANIAALSTNVPTIATSWSHKYDGIMRMLDQERYVCNIKNIDFEDIKGKIDELWEQKEKVRFKLEKITKEQEKVVCKSGKIITDLL
jgi:colanic acid/amylovoran biosynthesis protein